jgi:hypothetical protein
MSDPSISFSNCCEDIAEDVPLDSTLYIPWVRWVLCLLGGILLTVVSVTALFYREPGDSLPAFEQLSPLELGREEWSRDQLRVAYAPVLERILLVFGPADPALLPSRECNKALHFGEEQVLFDIVQEAFRASVLPSDVRQALKNAFKHKKCSAEHVTMAREAVAPYAEAIVRILHIRSLYRDVSRGAIVDRMCRHSKIMQAILPARLLIVVDTAARSYGKISTAVLFYELRHTHPSYFQLTDRLVAIFKKYWCK